MADIKKVVLLASVTFNGAEVGKDEVLELHAKNADSLVAEGVAKFADEAPATGGSEVDQVAKALDKLKKDELVAKAKAAGVEFDADNAKGLIIQAIIDQEKAAEVLA